MTQTDPSGYSGKPLHAKLGFKPGWRVSVAEPPPHYAALLAGAEGVTFDPVGTGDGYDAAHVFVSAPGDLPACASDGIARLRPGGLLWLSWAKKSSPLFNGVTEDLLRETVLPLGWVDVKVCALDADWSGLKFLKRKD